ncbi:chorismate mutase AroH [Alicyclobacillus contaminans]|uniref:chorismate mutase n=1 Tax=Alicyclobacillus contaminans TaxID=392016 RepID=UPI00040FCDA2|nr:chorismate mutase [Alicyclobacillus contaminans]GMA48687.1 chorismate mutase AroH [Alicyclobacillus contaminans]
MVIRGIRGATTVAENTPEAIFAATKELMETVIQRNQLDVEQVASVLLTMTPDLNADFPAKAVRSIAGWQWVPLMCAVELSVPGAMPRCIRMLVHVNTDKAQQDIQHVYLGEAVRLRPDMVEGA